MFRRENGSPYIYMHPASNTTWQLAPHLTSTSRHHSLSRPIPTNRNTQYFRAIFGGLSSSLICRYYIHGSAVRRFLERKTFFAFFVEPLSDRNGGRSSIRLCDSYIKINKVSSSTCFSHSFTAVQTPLSRPTPVGHQAGLLHTLTYILRRQLSLDYQVQPIVVSI